MLLLARRRRLIFTVPKSFRRFFEVDDDDTFNFGDLTEEHLNNPPLRKFLQGIASAKVITYFGRKTGVLLSIERPIALDSAVMLALWSNYDVAEKSAPFRVLYDWEQSKTFLNDAMNECLPYGSEPSELLWWWSMKNGWVSFCRLV